MRFTKAFKIYKLKMTKLINNELSFNRYKAAIERIKLALKISPLLRI